MFFANARVFDGTGRAPFGGEVLVKDNRIAAVGEADTLQRGDAEVVDCGGATLMPGMVEAHAHLSWPSSVGRIFDAMVLPPEEHLLVTARKFPEHGVTNDELPETKQIERKPVVVSAPELVALPQRDADAA